MGNFLSCTVGCNSATTTTILHTILNATTEQETYAKNSMEDLIQTAIAADVIPMDVLISLGAEWRDSHGKAIGILRSTSATTSVIVSSIFIWMIMRSYDRLSTTQHRLLLGLCISDIIQSLSMSTFNAMAPSDDDYKVWNARGNQDTCNTQGFLLNSGVYGGLYYNASLNIYFLAVVKYKKSEEFIRAKIEPFLHGVPLVVALSFSIYRLVKKHFNDDGYGSCVSSVNDPAHCVGYDVGEIREGFEIPCWRGINGAGTIAISRMTLYRMVLMFIPILIMIVSLGVIYKAVRTQEKKLSKYGVGSLRYNLQQSASSTPQQRTVQDNQSSSIWDRMSMSLTALTSSLKSRSWSYKKPVTRSNNSKQSQSRSVMHKAFGYTFAWFLSYGFYIIGLIIQLASGPYPLALAYLVTIFAPLQGLFNLLIFMHPKIMAAKKSKKQGGGSAYWCQAFSIAFWSRGKGGKDKGGTNRSNLRGGSKNRRLKQKNRNEDTASGNVKSPMFNRINERKTKRADTPQEEEKCEIEVPDNLNPIKAKAMYSTASVATYARNIVPSSTETATTHTVNPSTTHMVGMRKVDFEEMIKVCNDISDVVNDPDEDVMSNQDEEEEAEEIEEGCVDIVPMAADGPISANSKQQKEIVTKNQDVMDELIMDGDCGLASLHTTAGDGEQKEEEG